MGFDVGNEVALLAQYIRATHWIPHELLTELNWMRIRVAVQVSEHTVIAIHMQYPIDRQFSISRRESSHCGANKQPAKGESNFQTETSFEYQRRLFTA